MDTGVRGTVKFRTVSVGLILGIVACALLTFAAQKKGTATGGPVVLAQDKGKLTIKLGGQTVGHEEFEIAPSGGGWLAKGTAEIKPPEGSASKVSGGLISAVPLASQPAINGAPRRKKRTVRTSSSPTAWPASPWRCKARARSSRISRLTPRSSRSWITTFTISTRSLRASMTGPSAACRLFPCSFLRN